MAKLEPVKLVESSKNRRLSNLLWQEMSKLFQFIIAPDVYFSPFQMYMMPLDRYLQVYKKRSIMFKVKAEMKLDRHFYLFFEYDAAIILANMMRMTPASTIEEKLEKQTFNDKDKDAFGEVANQLTGCLDRLMREFLTENIHLVMDFEKNIYPDEKIKASSFESDREYAVLLSELKIPGFGKTKVTILIPQGLFEDIIVSPIELQGITPRYVVFYSHDDALRSRLEQDMRTRFTRLLTAAKPDEAIDLIRGNDVTCVGFDFDEINAPLDQGMKILVKRILTAVRDLPLVVFMKKPNPVVAKALMEEGIKGVSINPAEKVFRKWAIQHTEDEE